MLSNRTSANVRRFCVVISLLSSTQANADEVTPRELLPPLADTSATEGQNWPTIRGPGLDGISRDTGIADHWPEQGPPVLWTRELGQGYSSFVAWNDRIATQYQNLRGQFVVCLNTDTGETLWEHRYDWPYDPAGVYPGPRATPTYENGRLYFASPAGLIGCLDADSGSLLWSVELSNHFGCELTGFGYACSPMISHGKVLLPVGCRKASMVALNAESGEVVWQTGDDPASYAPAFPIVFQGRPLVLGYFENVLVCHDEATGKIQWRHNLSQGYDEHSSWPLYREPHLWISSPFRAGAELLELTGDPAEPVRSLGKQPLISNDIFSSVLLDGAIYGFDVRDAQAKTHRSTRGVFRCIDFLTGSEHWSVGDGRPMRESESGPMPSTISESSQQIGHASVIAADGKLILFNDLGELILARATPERFDELGRVSVLAGEICWSQPALSRGRLFVRNHSRTACLFLGDPQTLEADIRQRAVTTAAIPQQQYFDWASIILGVEPEYAFDLPSIAWLRSWFQVCLFHIMGGILLVLTSTLAVPAVRRTKMSTRKTVYWSLVFIGGAAGTTLLSRYRSDFVFTWPVCLFAAYQPLADRISWRRAKQTRRDRLQTGFVLLLFAATCLAYFLICRRLSLVFEWVFLIGFAAALPFSMCGRFAFAGRRWHPLWTILWTAVAFAAFYWSSVAFLYLRVR